MKNDLRFKISRDVRDALREADPMINPVFDSPPKKYSVLGRATWAILQAHLAASLAESEYQGLFQLYMRNWYNDCVTEINISRQHSILQEVFEKRFLSDTLQLIYIQLVFQSFPQLRSGASWRLINGELIVVPRF